MTVRRGAAVNASGVWMPDRTWWCVRPTIAAVSVMVRRT